MLYNKEFLLLQAQEYCHVTGTRINSQLGFGTQGMVFSSSRYTALKVHHLIQGYHRELSAYQRLREREMHVIQSMDIPLLLNYKEEFLCLELSIVHAPCILDFGGAYLDRIPEHVCRDEEWHERMQEEFGKNWHAALSVIKEFESKTGVFLADINAGNIRFEPKSFR